MSKSEKKQEQRKTSMLANGRYVEYSEEDIVKEFSSILSELLEKREPFVLIITPLKERGYLVSSPEIVLLSPLDVFLLEAKAHRAVIDLFDEIVSIRSKLETIGSKLKEYHKKPNYIS